MANTNTAVMAAVRRKCGYFDPDPILDARLQDVVETVSPRLASLLGYESSHEFTSEDGGAWGLFLNGCLYEFSDAWDDFTTNYADEILSTRLMILGAQDAQAQG